MKYRIQEIHRDYCATNVFTAFIKRHWWSKWEILFDSDVRGYSFPDDFEGQRKKIEAHKRHRANPIRLAQVTHHYKPIRRSDGL